MQRNPHRERSKTCGRSPSASWQTLHAWVAEHRSVVFCQARSDPNRLLRATRRHLRTGCIAVALLLSRANWLQFLFRYLSAKTNAERFVGAPVVAREDPLLRLSHANQRARRESLITVDDQTSTGQDLEETLLRCCNRQIVRKREVRDGTRSDTVERSDPRSFGVESGRDRALGVLLHGCLHQSIGRLEIASVPAAQARPGATRVTGYDPYHCSNPHPTSRSGDLLLKRLARVVLPRVGDVGAIKSSPCQAHLGGEETCMTAYRRHTPIYRGWIGEPPWRRPASLVTSRVSMNHRPPPGLSWPGAITVRKAWQS